MVPRPSAPSRSRLRPGGFPRDERRRPFGGAESRAAVARRLFARGESSPSAWLRSPRGRGDRTVATPVVARPEPGPAAPVLDEGDAALVARIRSDPPAEASQAQEPSAARADPLAAESLDQPVEEAPPSRPRSPHRSRSRSRRRPRGRSHSSMRSPWRLTWPPRPRGRERARRRDVRRGERGRVAQGDEPATPDAHCGRASGLDGAMVEDLAAAGITTRRAGGGGQPDPDPRPRGDVAQARRMRFLARRAADNLAAQAAEVELEPAADEMQESLQAVAAPSGEPEQSAEPAAEDALPPKRPGWPLTPSRLRTSRHSPPPPRRRGRPSGSPPSLRGDRRGAPGSGWTLRDRGASAHR